LSLFKKIAKYLLGAIFSAVSQIKSGEPVLPSSNRPGPAKASTKIILLFNLATLVMYGVR
jgi:hypothetical protein